MKKNILLIGGSSGIGLATAKLLSQNHEVYIASRSSDSLTGLDIHYLPFDVTTDDLSELDLPSELSGLVYCPGSINLRPFKGLKPSIRGRFSNQCHGLCQVFTSSSPKAHNQ